MRWIPCHEAATEAEAQLVVALLERHGIPCRVQPMGTSAFPTAAFGVRVLVSEDDLGRARTAIDGEDSAEPPPGADAWQCGHCHTAVDADLATCWSCGRPRGESPSAATPEPEVGPEATEPRLPILDTAVAGLRMVVARPLVFVAAVPGLAWAAIATAIGLPGQGFFASETCPKGSAALLSMPGEIFFRALGQGLAIAIAAGAARGASSWSEELALVGRKLPALIVVAALPLALWPLTLALGGVTWIVMPIVVYLAIRLIFTPVAILVHDVGIRAGLERSWTVTNGAWWRTLGLNALIAVVAVPIAWVPPPFRVVLACALGPVVDATLVVAYLRLAQHAGASPTPAPSAAPVGSAPPRALPSPPPLRP